MKISTKGRYALRVMIDLAEHQAEKYVPLKEVAARQEISEKYLENILKVLVEQGYKTVEVVEVELNEQEERILNVSLNKISGRWDNEKLTAILDELKEQGEMALTGFEDWELDALKVTYDHIEDLLNEDFSDTGKSEPTSYTMTFTLPEEVHEAMDKYIDENPAGKVELAQLLVNKAKGLI